LSQALVADQVGHRKVFKGQPAVGLGELARNLMKEASTDAGDAIVLSGQQASGFRPVSGTPLGAGEPTGTPPQPALSASQRPGSSETADLDAIGVSNNCEGADVPSVSSPGDRCGQDSGTRSRYGLTDVRVEVPDGTKHPPQPPGVVVHPDGSDLWEGDRPGMCLPDASRVTAARILLVSETKALAVPSLAPVSREADPASSLGVSSERSTKINGGLLEHLGGDLSPPKEPGHLAGRRPICRHHEHTASALACLPAAEPIDQVIA
jgi:hypothetical protein